jgi:hypothetical protein
VHSVDEIDVGVAGRAEEDGVAGSLSRGGVGGGIVLSEVGFDLDDASRKALGSSSANENFAEQVAGDGVRRAGEEAAGKGLVHRQSAISELKNMGIEIHETSLRG